METAGKSAPTGCYKCGRPGHWARDCPSDPIQDPNPNSNVKPNFASTSSNYKSTAAPSTAVDPFKTSKPKKLPRSRPKLTPQILLSEDGLGYVLRHFPRNFKYRGRGNEVSDLGNLIGMYREWHSHLLPYYSFDQFVDKVEQVGASKQVKRCIGELRERVAKGVDPTKLHEPPEYDGINDEQGPSIPMETMDTQPSSQHEKELWKNNADDLPEDILHEIYEKAAEEPSQSSREDVLIADTFTAHDSMTESQSEVSNSVASKCTKSRMSDEERARMESNRLKALEKAAARARSQQGS